jgi:hypothetical protein
MSGWIKLHRQIRNHWVFKNANYFKAWVVIISEVNHQSTKVLIEGELIECKRGQSINSLATWVRILGDEWTVQKLRTFLKLLEKDGMINTEGLRKTTRVTVCNYESYQSEQQGDNKQTTKRQQADNKEITTNKNEKKEKNEKNMYRAFNHLSISLIEFEKLKTDYTQEQIDKVLDSIENYKANKNYVSLYLTCKNWLAKQYPKSEAPKQQNTIDLDNSTPEEVAEFLRKRKEEKMNEFRHQN